jgi:hypothetical protein
MGIYLKNLIDQVAQSYGVRSDVHVFVEVHVNPEYRPGNNSRPDYQRTGDQFVQIRISAGI